MRWIVCLLLVCVGCAAGSTDRDDSGSSVSDSSVSDSSVSDSSVSDAGTSDAGASDAATADSTVPVTHVVSVTIAGDGAGTVTSTPAGLSCPSTCTTDVVDGATVTLHAAATSGSTFVGWTGGGCSGVGDCMLTVTADVAVEAAFALDISLVVTKDGTGSGVVTSSPAGIDCGGDCDETYAGTETVVLTALADTGSSFTGWSGACTGTGTCEVTMGGSVMVTATFRLDRFTLTVVRSGAGSGTVTSAPAGIACGTDCTEDYDYATTVVLTASPAGGSSFAGWSGSGCGGLGTCTVSMTAARSVTATFSSGVLTCTTVSNVGACTPGSLPEINLGMITSTACHDMCQVRMPAAGMTSGCWVLATNLNCYCRAGVISLGGSRPGGTCN